MNAASTIEAQEVRIPVWQAVLEGDLLVPPAAKGVILFAHGSGSGRFSPRNRAVAATLNEAGLATLLLDLLTQQEQDLDEVTGHLRFDISLLARRVEGAVDWLSRNELTGPKNAIRRVWGSRRMRIGLFGASTGAAAALVAAAGKPESVWAVVSRGGRPDLAGDALPKLACPVLLIVGGWDHGVIELNRQAMARMSCPCELVIVPEATHLFEEPGKLQEVARLAGEWFQRHLA
jgi:dienelactone hydrolase